MSQVPDALMFLSSHCPHCPAVLQALAELVKTGAVGRLEVVNLEVHGAAAAELGIRSVPWVRIGEFELPGLRGPDELAAWAKRAGSQNGMAEYFHAQLRDGGLATVLAMVRRRPDSLAALLPIVANPEASINVRIGAGAAFEELACSPALQVLVPQLGELTGHADARVRADACHYLPLAGADTARPYLVRCLEDVDPLVREVARESLEALDAGPAP